MLRLLTRELLSDALGAAVGYSLKVAVRLAKLWLMPERIDALAPFPVSYSSPAMAPPPPAPTLAAPGNSPVDLLDSARHEQPQEQRTQRMTLEEQGLQRRQLLILRKSKWPSLETLKKVRWRAVPLFTASSLPLAGRRLLLQDDNERITLPSRVEGKAGCLAGPGTRRRWLAEIKWTRLAFLRSGGGWSDGDLAAAVSGVRPQHVDRSHVHAKLRVPGC